MKLRKMKALPTAFAVLMLSSGAAMGAGLPAAHADTVNTGLSTPTNLMTYAATSSLIDLIWDPVAGQGVTYDVYQDGQKVATGLTKSNFTAQGLTAGRTYAFKVVAKDLTAPPPKPANRSSPRPSKRAKCSMSKISARPATA